MPRQRFSPHHLRVMSYVLIFVLLSIAAGQAPTPDKQAIRRTDFKNYTYHPDCLGGDNVSKGEAVRVRNGEYMQGKDIDRVYFAVQEVVYGDLNSDGVEEAVVRTLCNTGGTGQFTDGIIFTVRNNRPVFVTTLGTGDRADGGIQSVRIENGLLKVDRYGGNSGACCPDYIETYTFKLRSSELVAVGKPVTSDYNDPHNDRTVRRVQFQRGRSATTLKGTTTGIDEYLLGARAGQSMTLHITGNNLSLSLLSADGTELPQPSLNQPLTVKLPVTGDYRIVVDATTKGKASYTIAVTIR